VDAGVHCELRWSQEALVAYQAGVHPHTCVAQQVPALVGWVAEALTTVRAGVGSCPAKCVCVTVCMFVSVCVGVWSDWVLGSQ
jgi:hypothetical protein